MGEALRRGDRDGGAGPRSAAHVGRGHRALQLTRALTRAFTRTLTRTLTRAATLAVVAACLTLPVSAHATPRTSTRRPAVPMQDAPAPTRDTVAVQAGRFTVVAAGRDARLARTLLAAAVRDDRYPGLPPARAAVRITIASDAAHFRELVGPYAPEWGSAIAFPAEQHIIMQGSRAGSDAGDPVVVLRHELAHLALHEAMGALPPRWFDEGYASVTAGEFTREQMFETSLGMVWRTLPSLEELESGFTGGGMEAGWSYAMAHRIVSELRQLGGDAGLANFFGYWKQTGSFEKAIRQAYGMTGDGFEKHWRAQTRKRYGALSVVTNVSAALGVFAIVLVPLFISKRRRDRRKLEAMRAADAAQEAAARASALQALLDSTGSPPDPVPLPAPDGPRYPAA